MKKRLQNGSSRHHGKERGKNMAQLFASPGMYIQGYGELKNIAEYVTPLGDSFLVIGSTNRIKDFGDTIRASFAESDKLTFIEHNGSCTISEIEKIVEIAKEKGGDVIIGMGGGKVIDTAKAVAGRLKKRVVVVPTVAASDAATTRCAVIYKNDGSEDCEETYASNPDMVLVDTEIIMKAPKKFILAGMGDAMAKCVAAPVCYRNFQPNELGGGITELAFSLSNLIHDILMNHGELALTALDQGVMSQDLNKVIEMNVLISGIGCEVNGATTDHAFYAGFTTLKNRKKIMLHGEYVTFSSLATLVLEGATKETLDEYYSFCARVGLPVCLADLYLADMTEEDFRQVAQVVTECGGTSHLPFEVTVDHAVSAMKIADAIGKMYKEGKRLV